MIFADLRSGRIIAGEFLTGIGTARNGSPTNHGRMADMLWSQQLSANSCNVTRALRIRGNWRSCAGVILDKTASLILPHSDGIVRPARATQGSVRRTEKVNACRFSAKTDAGSARFGHGQPVVWGSPRQEDDCNPKLNLAADLLQIAQKEVFGAIADCNRKDRWPKHCCRPGSEYRQQQCHGNFVCFLTRALVMAGGSAQPTCAFPS